MNRLSRIMNTKPTAAGYSNAMHNSLTPVTRRRLHGLTAIAALTAMNALAADARYWDTTSDAGLLGGDGTWNTGTNWSTDAAGSNPLGTWLDNSDAYFQTPGTTNNVTLNGTVPAGLLDLSGSGTALNLSGGTLQLAAAATVNSGCTLQIGAGGATGSLDTASISNPGTLLLNRTGAASYAGSISGTGVLRNIGGGTFTLTGVMGTQAAPIGQVILKQGSTVIDTTGQLYTNTDFYVGQSSGDNATLTLMGNAKLDTSNTGMGDDRIRIGDGSSTGILNVQDSAVVTSGFDRYLRISSTSTINASGNATLVLHRVHPNGGVINITDNAIFTADGDFTPRNGTVFNVSGGQLKATGFASLATTTFNISGGLAYLTGSSGFNGGLFDGVGIGGSPTFNLTGGTLQWVTNNPFVIKDSSQGGGFPIFFNVGGTGILKTPSYGYKGPGPYPQVTFNLNGGTWQPLVNAMPSAVAIHVQGGGAKVDTSSSGLTIAPDLAHDPSGPAIDGGLTKSGSGTLTLSGSCTYTGPTQVLAGTLACTTLASLAPTALDIEDAASVSLAYAGTQALPSLKIAGSIKSAGVYGAVGSAAPVIEDSHLTGIGTVTVTGGASPFQTWISNPAFGVPSGKQGMVDDSDGDGYNNLMEFALNGNPGNAALKAMAYSFTNVSSEYGSGNKVLILTIAVRTGTPDFSLNPGPPATAVHPTDGIKYTVMGGTNLNDWTGSIYTCVNPIVSAAMPATPGPGYVYRSFILNSSNGLPGKGFLRVKVEPSP